jgi:hypothetical protein
VPTRAGAFLSGERKGPAKAGPSNSYVLRAHCRWARPNRKSHPTLLSSPPDGGRGRAAANTKREPKQARKPSLVPVETPMKAAQAAPARTPSANTATAIISLVVWPSTRSSSPAIIVRHDSAVTGGVQQCVDRACHGGAAALRCAARSALLGRWRWPGNKQPRILACDFSFLASVQQNYCAGLVPRRV